MLEKDERVAPGLVLHSFGPRLQFRVTIVGPPQSQIIPIRSRYERNLHAILRFGAARTSDRIMHGCANSWRCCPGIAVQHSSFGMSPGSRKKSLRPRHRGDLSAFVCRDRGAPPVCRSVPITIILSIMRQRIKYLKSLEKSSLNRSTYLVTGATGAT